MRQQILGDLAMRVREARRPADDVELVRVAGPDGIRAVLGQFPHDADVPLLGREVQGHGVVAVIADVRVGTARQQDVHDLFGQAVDREVERGASAGVAAEHCPLVDDVRLSLEKRAHGASIALIGGAQQCFDELRSIVRGVAASLQSILARTPGMYFSSAVMDSSVRRCFSRSYASSSRLCQSSYRLLSDTTTV